VKFFTSHSEFCFTLPCLPFDLFPTTRDRHQSRTSNRRRRRNWRSLWFRHWNLHRLGCLLHRRSRLRSLHSNHEVRARFDGRKAAEFPFQAQDPLVNKSQGEALNPTIIAKRICDQLTNVCKANDAAKTACTAALAALGGRVAQTANDWNTQLEFAGTNLNPDNAPQSGLVGYD
jgi:hypothetical protein